MLETTRCDGVVREERETSNRESGGQGPSDRVIRCQVRLRPLECSQNILLMDKKVTDQIVYIIQRIINPQLRAVK